MITLSFMITALLFGLCGLAITLLYSAWATTKNQNKHLTDELKNKELALTQLQVELRTISSQNAGLEANLQATVREHQRAQNLLHDQQKSMAQQFEILAQKIFQEKTQSFRVESEKNLLNLLNPLREGLKDFQKKVEDTYQNEARERFALKDELKRLMDLQNRMETETVNLTKALKGDVKAQGSWGEIMLERLLESAGLREGEEYLSQAREMKLKDEDGHALRPDVVINLPEGKHLIIDSKVSLTHYHQYVQAANQEEATRYLTSFKNSLAQHIQGLAGKKYHFLDKIEAPEFTLMFFPIEGAYGLALQSDPTLFTYCWDRGIVIVGPTTLLATLKTVASLWRQERQNQNAMKIALESGKLYDKFVGLVEDLEGLGRSIANTQKSFETTMNKLSEGKGNLIGRVEAIKKLGARATKELPNHLVPESYNEADEQ